MTTLPATNSLVCRIQSVFAALALAVVAGCGTTNAIFYPNERATKAADSVIDDIIGQPRPTTKISSPPNPQPPKSNAAKQ